MDRYVALGLVLIAAGLATAAGTAVPRFLDVGDRIEAFPRTRLSEGSVQLQARDYDVYLDVPAGWADTGWTLSIRGPGDREPALRPAGAEVTYEWAGREGSRIGKLRAVSAGRHVVRGSGPAGADVVFADDVVGDMGRSVLYAAGSLVLLGGTGLLVLIIGLARRRPREPRRWP